MKRLLLGITLIYLAFAVFGKDITIDGAKQVAKKFLTNSNSGLKNTSSFELEDAGDVFAISVSVKNNFKTTTSKNRDIYVFNIEGNQGFIIISGDDAAIPVLGYSNSGHIDVNNSPRNVIKWLESYKQQIQFIKQNNIEQTETIKALWNGDISKYKSTNSSVAPLISTKWNQAPYVNALCPFDEDYQELTVTGCPATAMAQIMKYWKYPEKGTGFHSYQHEKYGILSANFGSTYYDWDAMPDVVNNSNNAVATLMYHCGVAVEMSYNVAEEGGSGSYVIKDKLERYSDNQTVEHALYTYFGYATTIEGLVRSDYSDNQWKTILKTELDAGRPVQYAGYGQGGHTFVCDGYDQNEYFHMNWGWGGYYDGYYLLDALSPGSGGIGSGAGSYNEGQQALIGIKPSDGASQSYELEIYSDVELDKSTIAYGEGFTVSTDLVNVGTSVFNGDYCAAAFDENEVFIDFVEIKSDYSLSAGYHYTNGLDFTTDGMLSLLPGNYYIYIFSRQSGENWNLIKSDNYNYYVELEVVNENTISLYSTINVQTSDIYSNGSLSVWLDVVNNSAINFTGIFDVSLYNLDGEFVTTIEERTNMTLNSNSHYANGLTFSTNNVDVSPGTYLLALLHKQNGGDYELTGSTTSYINPIEVIVKEAPLEEDIYENNNSKEDSYTLDVNYISNSTNISTYGSNFHVGNDWDFYSIDLNVGYKYNIDIRLHDSYNTGNDETYTVDGLFLYSLDGVNWSEIYDDVMQSSITANGNSTLYCVVSPYFLGETGTYLLEIDIDRVTVSGAELSNASDISIYPNPCEDFVTLSGLDKLTGYSVFDLTGRVVLSGNFLNNHNDNIDLSLLEKGVYIIEIKADDRVYKKQIIKK